MNNQEYIRPPLLPMCPSTRWWHGGQLRTTVNTYAPAANRLYFIPYLIPYPVTFDTVGFQVVALEASGEARLGIYNNNGLGEPGDLLNDWGTVATTTTGAKSITIDFSPAPDLYFLGIVFNTVATLVVQQNAATAENGVFLGAASLTGAPIASIYQAHTYDVLPTVPGTLTYHTDSPIRMMLRRL